MCVIILYKYMFSYLYKCMPASFMSMGFHLKADVKNWPWLLGCSSLNGHHEIVLGKWGWLAWFKACNPLSLDCSIKVWSLAWSIKAWSLACSIKAQSLAFSVKVWLIPCFIHGMVATLFYKGMVTSLFYKGMVTSTIQPKTWKESFTVLFADYFICFVT